MIGEIAQSAASIVGLWFVPVAIAFCFAWATNHAPDWSSRWYAAGQTALAAGAIGAGCSAAFPFASGAALPDAVILGAAIWGVGGLNVAPWAIFLLGPIASSTIARRGGGALAYVAAGAVVAGALGQLLIQLRGDLGVLVPLVAALFGVLLSLVFRRFELTDH